MRQIRYKINFCCSSRRRLRRCDAIDCWVLSTLDCRLWSLWHWTSFACWPSWRPWGGIDVVARVEMANNVTEVGAVAGQLPRSLYTPTCRVYDFVIETVLMGSLCLFGFAGNTLSMICLRRDRSNSATPLLLISLEISDTLFLTAVLVVRVISSFQVQNTSSLLVHSCLPAAQTLAVL